MGARLNLPLVYHLTICDANFSYPPKSRIILGIREIGVRISDATFFCINQSAWKVPYFHALF